MNRQVCIVLAITFLALALPLAGVILTLQRLMKRGPEASQERSEEVVSEALQSMLEGIADKKLAAEEPLGREFRIEFRVDELNGEKTRIEGLLKSYGGIAIPTLESDAEIRLLVQIPADNLQEFLLACRASPEGKAVDDLSGGLLEVVIKRTNSP